MAHKTETLETLATLIAQAKARLERQPDYIELAALQKAWDEITKAHRNTETVIDDQTGEKIVLVATGDFAMRPKRPSQLEATAMALNQARVPLTASQIVAAAIRLGAKIGGKKPATNLGSTLSRSEEFVSVRWKGERAWWFANKPVPHEGDSLLKAAE